MSERRRVPVDPAHERSKLTFGADAFRDIVAVASGAVPADCDCPRLDRDEWHEVESDWTGITFVKTGMNAVVGVPVGYAGAKDQLIRKAARAGASIPDDPMVLLGEGTMRRPVMLEIEDVPPGATGIERPGGVAFTRLVPAPLGRMKHAVVETKEVAKQRYGREPDAIWIWYLTCRVCSSPREFETLILAHYREAK